jgi:hypothetical protein
MRELTKWMCLMGRIINGPCNYQVLCFRVLRRQSGGEKEDLEHRKTEQNVKNGNIQHNVGSLRRY